jgi:hypothetical protein
MVMQRLRLSAYVVVMALGAGGCREAMTGTLSVSETVAVSSTSGLQQLPPGQYPVKITGADSHTLTMRIEPRTGDVITARLKSKAAPDSEGEGRIPSSESGQDFDVTYQLSSFRSEAPLPTITESCTFDTTESRCRMVTDYDFRSGQSSERWECVQVPVTLRGVLTTSSVKVRSARRVDGQVLDPKSGRQLAWLRAETDRDRSYRASTHCALPNR